jgi:hypothetical protein
MMTRSLICAALAVALVGTIVGSRAASAAAATPPPKANSMAMPSAKSTPAPTPDPAEAAFIADVTKTLQAKYPTSTQATAGGYYQMTRLEDDGTSIWFNDKWGASVSKYAPNFLWFDKNGKLVGLDYQYTVSTNPKPPSTGVYPVKSIRWSTIDAHMHFAYKLPDGKIKRRGAMLLKGETADPTAAQLTAAKLLPPKSTLLWAHYHPKAWDLGFWLVPNPNGAFADLNPLVKP